MPRQIRLSLEGRCSMWSIFPAAAILLAQAQPDPAEKWCFERGQNGAQLCEDIENSCNALLKINPEIATGPCLRVEPRLARSFYFDETHVIDAMKKIAAGRLCYWLRLGRVDVEQGEGLGLDRGRGSNQGNAVSGVEGGGHLVERAGGEVAQQALEAVHREGFVGALAQRRR